MIYGIIEVINTLISEKAFWILKAVDNALDLLQNVPIIL